MNARRGRTAIVGTGEVPTGRFPDRSAIEIALDAARLAIRDAGIDKEMIHTLPEPPVIEESSSIISYARKHECGTIVMGRRKEGMAKGILGSVSSRTIMQTQDMALWIIG